MSDSRVDTVRRGGKRKFLDGARVKGCEEGQASFRGRTGTVVGYVGRSREYKVNFDDGRVDYAYAHSLEAA
jgi:ribosomal protein L21E